VDSGHSVTGWIEDLKQGDSAAMKAIWDRFYPQLLPAARKRLKGMKSRAKDEEDVALSAMYNLFVAVGQGRFPDLTDRKDLWRVLLHITGCKAFDLRRHESRQKRGGNRKRQSLAADSDQPPTSSLAFDEAVAETLTPDFAAMVIEEFERLLALLKKDRYREVAIAKLKGYTNKELASRYGCAEKTIERHLTHIRLTWQKDQAR
jgi:DNA-directed RNA polymerase specialized sigma24 family protein